MSKRSDLSALRKMLKEAQKVGRFLGDRTPGAIHRDEELRYAVVKALENIGETATRISERTQSRFTDITWSEIIGLRNRLTHAYDRIDVELVVDIIESDLDELISKLQRAIQELD